MGERGPKSRKKIIIEDDKTNRPNPPRGMSKNARTVWWRIVLDFPTSHFKPKNYDLLRAFCESSASHKAAVSELQKGDKIVTNPKSGATKKNPLYAVISDEVGRMAQLSTKLGLNINVKEFQKPRKSKWDGLLYGSPGFKYKHKKN